MVVELPLPEPPPLSPSAAEVSPFNSPCIGDAGTIGNVGGDRDGGGGGGVGGAGVGGRMGGAETGGGKSSKSPDPVSTSPTSSGVES